MKIIMIKNAEARINQTGRKPDAILKALMTAFKRKVS
jgi:hypothetical protein